MATIPSVAPQETVIADRIPKGFGPPGDRILVDVVRDSLPGGLFDLNRRREIGKALGEIDSSVADREAAHFADDGLFEFCDSRTCEPARGRH